MTDSAQTVPPEQKKPRCGCPGRKTVEDSHDFNECACGRQKLACTTECRRCRRIAERGQGI